MDDVKDRMDKGTDPTSSPLRLGRETLRELDDLELEQVAGGKKGGTSNHKCF